MRGVGLPDRSTSRAGLGGVERRWRATPESFQRRWIGSSFAEQIGGVGGKGTEAVDSTGGPDYFALVDARGIAQPEVEPRVVGRLEAAPADPPARKSTP